MKIIKFTLRLSLVLFGFTAYAQLSFAPADTLVKGYDDIWEDHIMMFDGDNDGIDEILHIEGNQLFMVDNSYAYSNESLIYSGPEGLYFFSNQGDLNNDGYQDFAITSASNIYIFTGSDDGIHFN